MEYTKAREYTKTFRRGGIEITPIFASDWIFLRKDKDMYILSKQHGVSYKYGTLKDFIDTFIVSKGYTLKNNNELVGGYYFTSLGFKPEKLFLHAQDTMEMNEDLKIEKKDLEKGLVYLSKKGTRYIYIGKIDYSVQYIQRIEITDFIDNKMKTSRKNKRIDIKESTEELLYNIESKGLVLVNFVKIHKEINYDYSYIETFLPFRYYGRYGAESERFTKVITNLDFIDIKVFNNSPFDEITERNSFYERIGRI